MNEKRIAVAAFLPLLLVCGVSAQDRLSEHLQALTAAGFAGASISAPPPTPSAQEAFATEFVYGLNEAVSIFPAIKIRQDAFQHWAQLRSKEPRRGVDFEPLSDIDFKYGKYNGPITTYAGRAGQLNLRMMAIPLYVSRWRLVSLELAYLSYIKASSYSCRLECLLDYYRKHGEVTSETHDWTNEKRVVAMITALELQKDYEKILQGLLPETVRWSYLSALDKDHLEPGQVSPGTWTALKEIATAIDAALAQAEAEEAADPWRRGAVISRPAVPAILTSEFFTNLDLPIEASERKRAELVRAMKANKVETCGHRGTCFYDENGRLSHWVLQTHRGYVTGYAAVEREQKSFNAWADKLWHTSRPPYVSQSGHLNIETFRMPVVKADYIIDKMWINLLNEAGVKIMDSRITRIWSYIDGSVGRLFEDGIFKARADALVAAYTQTRAYERALVKLDALRRPGVDQREINTDPIEASSLPAGLSQNLSSLRMALEQAVAGAEEVEAASR